MPNLTRRAALGLAASGVAASDANATASHKSRVGSVSIVEFGADPTGSTDSTDAIKAAINSGASHVVAPAGKYRIKSVSFSPWGIPGVESKPFVFDASAAHFVHANDTMDRAMFELYPGKNRQLIRCVFKFGFVEGSPNVKYLLYLRQCNNCRIEAAYIGPGQQSTGVFVDQERDPPFGSFNNLIEIQDIADCKNAITIYADVTGVNGFEGNIVTIGRIGACAENGLTIGRQKNVRVIFNTFVLGPIEHCRNGYGIYERGGGNQYYVNNLNSNQRGIGALGGLSKKSLFIVSNEGSVDVAVEREHSYIDVHKKAGTLGR